MNRDQRPVRRGRVRFLLGAGSVPIVAALAGPTPASAATVNLCANILGITINTCDASAASYALASQGGISIGGNQVSGLGNSLTPSSAGEINSIAIGNGATTLPTAISATAIGTGANVGATNGIALGTGASTVLNATSGTAIGSGAIVNASNGVALGSGATTLVTATSGTAIGSGASAGAANSVAIGAGSMALRAPGTYTAAVTGTSTPVAGEFSVGSALGQRQITNVAAGSQANDAVNVAQLSAVNSAVAANTSSISGLQSSLTSNLLGLGTLKTTVDANATTLDALGTTVGALGTTVSSVNSGLTATNAAVTDLTKTVNQNTADIATATGDIATNTAGIASNAASLSTVSSKLNSVASMTTANTNNVATLGTQLGQNILDTAKNTTDIATNAGTLNTIAGQVTSIGNTATAAANGLIDANDRIGTLTTAVNTATGTVTSLGNQVAQNTADTLANSNAVTGLTNQVTGLSTNVGALSATVQANSSAIGDLGTQIASGSIGPVRFSDPSAPLAPLKNTITNDLTLVGKNEEDPVALHNVASGTVAAGSTDAVNGGQVFALGQTVNSLTDLAVSYDNKDHSLLTLGGTGATAPVSLANVAAGRLGLSSTDAVNGSQLFDTNTQVDNNSANIVQNTTDIGNLKTSLGVTTDTLTNQASQLLTLGGKVDQNSTDIASTIANVASLTGVVQQNGKDITDLGTQLTAQNGKIEANTDAIGLNADAIIQLRQLSATGAIGPVRYSNSDTPTTPNGGVVSNDVTIVGTGNGPVAVHNVAAGNVSATSTDAINGSQLYALTSQIGSSDGLAVAYDDSSKAKVTLGGVSAITPTTLTNLADGKVQAGSTDAVTGNQLSQTNDSVSTVSNRVDLLNTTVTNNYKTVNQTLTNLGTSVTALAQSAVTYDDDGHTQVTFGNSGSPVSLTNVAAGKVEIGSTDAVNGDQLAQTNSTVTNNYNTLNQTISTVNNSVTQLQNLAVTYDDGSHTRITLGDGKTPVAFTNVADGRVELGSTDAVNGNQLAQTNQSITNVENRVDTLNTAVTNNYNTLNQNISTVNNSVTQLQELAVTYDDGSHTRITLGDGKTPVALSNVADGRVELGSTDAVNGNQLAQTNQSVTDVNTRVDTLNTQVTTNTTNLNLLSNNYANLTTNISNGGIGPVQYSYAGATQTSPNGGHPTNDLTLVGADKTAAVALHNVASGQVSATSTDAINGSQLYAVASQIGSSDGLAVSYDDSSKTQVSLGGTKAAAPVSLTNVADGKVEIGSTDAVNGNQLAQTNNTVTNNYNALSQSVTNVDNRVDTLNTAVTNNYNTLNQSITNVGASLGQLQELAVTYDDGSHTRITLGDGKTPVALTNVADGTVAIGSTDAVNGNQLAQTNQSVTNVDNRVDTLNTAVTNNYNTLNQTISTVGASLGQLQELAVTYDDGSHTRITLGDGKTPVALSNVADGRVELGSTDAVNGNQLAQTNQSVTDVNTRVDTLNTQVTTNTTNLNLLSNNYASLTTNISNGGIGPVQYSYAGATQTSPNGGHPTNDLTLVGADKTAAVTLHNVAPGQVSATSTDAINGSQLYAVSSQISGNGGLAVSYDDSSKTQVSLGGAQATAPVSLTNVAAGRIAAGSTDAVNGDQLAQTNSTVTNNYNTLNQSISTVGASLGQLQQIAVTYDDGSHTRITLGDGKTPVALSNVADGVVAIGSTDAVNGNQLAQTNQSIANITSSVTNNTTNLTNLTNNYTNLSTTIENGAVGPVQYSYADSAVTPNGGTPTNDLTLVGADTSAPVALHNVADGRVALGSTDAVNGNQLAQTNQSIANINTSVTTNTTNLTNLTNNYTNLSTNIENGAVGPVQYANADTPTTANGGTPTNDLTLVGAVSSSPVALHNVAAGLLSANSTDAINGSQLAGLGSAMASTLGGMTYNPATNSYTGSFTYAGNSYGNVQAVFNAIGSNVGSGSGTGGGDTTDTASKYFHANSVAADSQALGQDSTAVGPNAVSSGSQSVAMGANAQAQSDQSVAIGSGAMATNGRSVSIGQGNTASGNGAVALGDPSVATGDGAVVAGKDNTATGTGAIAMGNTSTAIGDGAVSLGNTNTANGLGAVSLGSANVATGDGAIAIGSNNNATGNKSLAIGSNVTTSANDTLSVGNNTVADATSAVAFGNRAMASGVGSISVGNDTTATGEESSSYGTHSDSTGDFATAIGSNAQASGLHTAALGYEANASGIRSTALGADAVANADYTLAVGQMSTASARGGVAVGLLAQATGYAGTALGSGAVASQEGSVALGADSETQRGGVSNYSAFGLSDAQTSLGEVAVARSISYEDLTTGIYTPTGNRQITGVAAGSADTDAVNVSQLRGVSASLGTVIASGLGGGTTYNSLTGSLTGPSYNLFGTSYSNVGDALQALASYDTANGGTGGNGITNPNLVTYSDDSHSAVNLAGNGTTIHNVAAGAVTSASTDAVNGSQLAATNTQVAANTAAIGTLNTQVAANTSAISTLSTQVQNGAVGTVQYSNADTPAQANGGTKTNDVTLVGANAAAPVGLHNVAAGTVSSTSTDAVNGSQLAATNARVSTVETTANSAMAMGQNSVQYDTGSSGSSITLGGATSSTAVGLHNVADGTSANDAVNLGQLASATNAAVSQSNAYTDSKIAAVQFDLAAVRKDANAGTAGAMAMAAMPQPYEAGRGMISGGVATYQGQTAMALGIAKALSDEHTVIKIGATYNSRSQVGVSGGIGYQF